MATRIGLNLNAVREALRQDLSKTLEQVAAIGYHGVELAGACDYLPGQFRHCLDDFGLACAGAHVAGRDLEQDLEETATFHQRLGNRLLIVSELPWERLRTPEAWQQLAEQFNLWSDKLAWMEMQIGLHIPGRDYPGVFGVGQLWDAFLESARPDIVLEVNTAGVQEAGIDPADFLRAHPVRCRNLHLAAGSGQLVAGAPIAAACREIRPDWVIADLADPPSSPWAGVEQNYRFILDQCM